MFLTAGDQLGRYQILAPVGKGGMGEVYRARDTRLERDVAIKVLPGELAAEPGALRRLEVEAKALAALAHPNIVTVFDVGSANASTFIVTELLEGETVRSLVRRGPLPWRRAVDICRDVAMALSAAHGSGIVHRDIKPENLFVTTAGVIKVLDFGIARRATVATQSTTITSAITGTPGYMSPEQTKGAEVDHRTDVFSLGCVLHELITGVRPFRAATFGEYVAVLFTETPQGIDRQVAPMAVSEIVSRCLEKDPARRPGSAAELSLALARMLEEAPGVDRPSRRAVFAGGALAASGAALFAYRALRTPHFDSIAVLPLANPDPVTEYVSDGITEGVINRLSRVSTLRVAARSTVFRYKGKNDPLSAGRDLHVSTVVSGRLSRELDAYVIQTELVNVGDGSQMWGERYTRPSAELPMLADIIARDLAEHLSFRLAGHNTKPATDAEAYMLYLKGRFYWNQFTQAGFAKSIEYFNAALRRDPTYALAYSGLADTYATLAAEGFVAPKEVMGKCKAAALRAIELDNEASEAHLSLAICQMFYEWDWAAAESSFRRSMALNRNSPDAHHFYSHYLQTQGRAADAQRIMERAVQLDPLSLIVNTEYGFALYLARRYDDAIAQLRRSIAMDRDFFFAAALLAQPLERKGMVREALAALDSIPSEWSWGVLEKACALAVAGDHDAARRLIADAQAMAGRTFVDPVAIAMVYAELHDSDRAFEWLDRGCEERSSLIGLLLTLEPKFDLLRTDRRYTQLVRRIGVKS